MTTSIAADRDVDKRARELIYRSCLRRHQPLRGNSSVGLRQQGEGSMHSGVNNDHYSQRDEHEKASRVEDVFESYDGREYEPGEHDTSEENRTGTHD